jgi:putative hydrolase of the HAD superfamily
VRTVRAVIFDYGDVLSYPADPAVIRWMAEQFGVDEQLFREVYGRFRHEYDRGTYTAGDYWGHIANATGRGIGEKELGELRKADVAMWAHLNPLMLNWAQQLRATGYKTAVLSNMHADMIEHIRANGEWTKQFDCLTLSSSIKMAKPEPAIFEHCLNMLGLPAEHTLFVDDREANIRGAGEVGILGVLATSPRELRENLGTLGFEPLPEL